MINPNTIVGNRYRVTRSLGGGGMKLVYLAEDLRLAARPCALAEMVDSFTNPEAQTAAVAAFQREADMLAELNHEHIPRVYDRFSELNRHYLVMEYVDGETLEERLKSAGGKLDETSVIDVALQILDTLDYIHTLNPPVIYRDLKPSNVMITRSGQLKLIDFGIARHFQPLSNATMIGTQGYAPPEQYRGKVEVRSDLYALGATMHHALSGRDPTAEAPFSFPPLRKLVPDCNPALADLVGEALSYDVERRISSAQEFKRRLLAIKIEKLTGGLVGQADANVALAAASVKAQLKLPLGAPKPAMAAGSSSSAPTLVISGGDIPCPQCSRLVPPDSRFCSYCAADLRRVLGAPNVVLTPEAETARLPEAQAPAPYQRELRRRSDVRHHRRGIPVVGLVAIFLGLITVLRVIPYVIMALAALATASHSPPTPEASLGPPGFPGGSDDGEINPPSGDTTPEGGEPQHHSTRAIALRRVLDQRGYREVHFRLRGSNIELWGAVPSEADRLMVETTAFAVTGVVSLNDHVQVSEAMELP